MGQVRILMLLALLGIWEGAASVLEAPLAVTAFITLGAVALGAWTIAVVVAPDGADLSGLAARRVILVGHDGSAWSTALP